MKKILCILLTIACASVYGAEAPQVPGRFNVSQGEKGSYSADFQGPDLSVEAEFPGKPDVSGQSVNYIMQNPLVQMSILIANRQNMTPKDIIEMMMNTIGKEYTNMDLKIVDAQKTDLKQSENKTTQQYIIDLENGFREFTTVNVYQNQKYDVVVMSRFILSAEDKENTELRTKGNSIAADFLKNASVSFSKKQ